jgi:hypothetical protein
MALPADRHPSAEKEIAGCAGETGMFAAAKLWSRRDEFGTEEKWASVQGGLLKESL